MRQLPAIFIIGLLACTCCESKQDALFRPWCKENAETGKAFFNTYEHVVLARITETSWEDLGPNHLTPRRSKGTVVKSYKGDWKPSEPISFVHWVDAPAPKGSTTNRTCDDLVFILTNDHTNSEIVLDTGDFTQFSEELVPALEYTFPEKSEPSKIH